MNISTFTRDVEGFFQHKLKRELPSSIVILNDMSSALPRKRSTSA